MKKLIALFLIFFNAGCASVMPLTNVSTGTDTIPSKILISHKPPSFGHSIDGYCIYQGNHCTGRHLRYWHRQWIVIGPEYTVWGCKRRGAK
jgi:hypothetical protein